ncbi:uncharacterized protein A4U43_C07F8860 [Asparagus officinalis]|uniref:RNA helicase n=1 Tax=Asparagus officinalis TaxID=4686 RepID=A0A5P1ECC3_ASPOF|nr:uncharacterized protein A4U43_C07F8860 [Asparagus officinalis]
MEDQFEELAHNPDIIIATPGRLMHHLVEVDGMSLRTVEYIVFDEADALFGMGFAQQLHTILSQLSENRQTLLFSATLPRALAEFAKSGLRDYKHIMLDQKISPDLSLLFLTVRPEEKVAALLYLVREKIGLDQQTLIFVSTNYRIQFLNILFREEGVESSISYSTMDACARKNNLSKFKARKTMLLIASDNVERGIDIPSLDNVVHFDFPYSPKKFFHKMGRVARAGRKGTAYSFVTPADMPYLLDFHMFFSKPLRPAPTEEEVLHDMEGIYSRIDQALANGETIYGRFPQKFIDLVSDRVREVISGCADLMALQKPCANGFRLHTKIKSKPSRESIRRANDLPLEGVHPMFKALQGSSELTALAFFERLKAFRLVLLRVDNTSMVSLT